MRTWIIICMSFLFVKDLGAVPRFRQQNVLLDKVQITYYDPSYSSSNKNYKIYIYMQEGYSANFGGRDALDLEKCFWTVSAGGANLFLDWRSYSDYYTDIPIGILIQNIGEQKLTYKETEDRDRYGVSASVATAIELRNTADPNICHDFMTKGDYTFSADSEETISTYYLRIWGANRVKENIADAEWNSQDAWENKKSPEGVADAYVFVPANAQIKMSSLSGKAVDTVNNEGTLTIDEKSDLTAEQILNKGLIHNSGTLSSKEIILY